MFTVTNEKHGVITTTTSYNEALKVYDTHPLAYRLTRYNMLKDSVDVIKEKIYLTSKTYERV